jgi:hypothetical protein
MGKLLENEAKIFSSMLDGVVVMSEQEASISQWLGAKSVLYLPRLLSPNYIDWKATVPIAGFAGTLDHLPNRLGLELLAGELAKLNFNHKLRVIGGPESIGTQLQSNYPFIEYAGPVADSALADEIAKWSVWINPVFWYARGASTKLAQAINWGIPCITTPAGRRGYELSNTAIVTADNTAAGFAQKLMLALNDSSCLNELHHAVQENAENFNTGHFVEQLVAFLDKIATSA